MPKIMAGGLIKNGYKKPSKLISEFRGQIGLVNQLL